LELHKWVQGTQSRLRVLVTKRTSNKSNRVELTPSPEPSETVEMRKNARSTGWSQHVDRHHVGSKRGSGDVSIHKTTYEKEKKKEKRSFRKKKPLSKLPW